MKRTVTTNLVGLFILLALTAHSAMAASDSASAARGVLERVIGPRARDFTFEQIASAPGGLDVFEVQAANGKVTVRGNTAVAMCRGAYDYLRQECHCMFTWEGEHMDLPAKFPDMALRRAVSPYPLRQYYNVCTFGYTTAYWDWPQWQHELDWMALHGINMPLAEVATEAIWRHVWLSMGITQKELDKYFTGPAFFPWHRMGNINGWDGPVPESFWDKQIALEKKIVDTMRELGMKPIAPAFGGFVPPAI
ncbi:MAG TPA: alpha-N-acetylglucosaminidase TIM-barrel domain-containing protein, partial [Tepidisphaeraceae bacterium]|nr:alpha-N-acetylglucosaminidase TIM-barrel domain-containing protein [Tepidisphaeraceae bacterium]